MMQDTKPETKQKQLGIIFSKTEGQRLMMGLDMMDDVRKIVMQSITSERPDISETDRKIEFVKRYYRKDFTPEQLNNIASWLRTKQ